MAEFDVFFRDHAPSIWNYLRRLTGDPERSADLFQRIFLKAWSHFDSRTRDREKGWLFAIAVNEARDDMRRRRRDRIQPQGGAVLPERAAGTDLSPEDRELVGMVMQGLQELPAVQRELFLLVRYHGFSFAEAAGLVGVGLSSAKMTVARTHERLMKILASKIHLGSLL